MEIVAVLKEAATKPERDTDAALRSRKAFMEEVKKLSRKRHEAAEDTVARVRELKQGRTWRDLARFLGYDESFAATLCAVAAAKPGTLTRITESELRGRLGLPASLITQEVGVCPSCLAQGKIAVHLAPDCQGKTVEVVAVLGPGEMVKKVRSPARRNTWKSIALRAQTAERFRQAAKGSGLDLSSFASYLLTLYDVAQNGGRSW